MSLFEVKGWNLKADKIAVGGANPNDKKKSQKKERKEKKRTLESEKTVDVKASDSQRSRDTKPTEEKSRKKKKIERVASDDSTLEDKHLKVKDHEKTASKPHPSKSDQFITKEPASERKLTPLQQKMMAKLSGSRFRWINEQLYTTSSENALKLVQEQPALFDEYHEGFRSQVQLWPENPVDVFVQQFEARTAKPVNAPGGLPGLPDKSIVVADMGCGEAQLALDIQNFVKKHNSKNQKKKGGKQHGDRNGPAKSLNVTVHSFDLKKANDRITVADIKNVPLPDESCSIVVFCLALMGTNFLDFVEEAYRILAPNGELWIAEIKSRFTESTNAKTRNAEDVGSEFVESLKLLGFFHKKTDNENKMFTRFEFFKPSKEIIAQRKAKLEKKKKFIEQETKREELELKRKERAEGEWLLKPCIYKRR
uniref:Ribosomal RNA-processing protein 8 n=1 Tax=Candidozyma auris TaxID=498019 RepID=A0A0L0P6F4_CANAR